MDEAADAGLAILALVADTMAASSWVTDANLALLWYRGDALKSLISPLDLASDLSVPALAQRRKRVSILEMHRSALRGESLSYEAEFGERTYRVFLAPRRDDAGEVVGVLGLALDLTAQVAALDAVHRTEQTLALMQSGARLGSWMLELASGVFSSSSELSRLCGRPDDALPLTASALARFVHEDDRLALEAAIDFARDERRAFALESRLVGEDGVERWVQHRGKYDYDDRGPVRVIGTVQDITARKRAEQHVAYQVNYDDLTGLPNRKLLADRLRQALLQAGHNQAQVALLYVDLDRFKAINDTLGHAVGDQFLRAVAPRLLGAVRDTDTIARSGGDEFLIMLPDITSVGEAARIAERVVATFSQPVSIDERELYSSASVGIAIFPDDGATADDLIRSAEAALYRAKEGGHGTFRFYAAVTHARAVDRLGLEHGLRQAFEREEFTLVYQPLVDRYERPVAVEALLRWHDSEVGSIGPDVFIPLCEEIGLIVPLGRWVIRRALEQLAAWNAIGLNHLRMALNISGRQIVDPTLTMWIRETIEDTGVLPGQIEIEITESVLMGDVPGARSVIADLRAIGLRISLDDFGTGYSSLSYLKHFNVDALKIDRTFIRDLPHDRGDSAIVSAVIALGHAMGLSIVAEGVETAEQAAYVARLGCDEMQGFYFAKPMPAAALERLLRAWTGVGNVS